MATEEHGHQLTSFQLRIARPTNDIPAIVEFYRDVLGFEVLGQFTDHDGFDGVMLGHANAAYHLEFTCQPGHRAPPAPTAEHLLVFYVPDEKEWRAIVQRIEARQHRPVKSHNPYWDRSGRTYEDPDGYRIVIQNAASPV